jgi:uncharacterized membrane protein (UPF0127 family)
MFGKSREVFVYNKTKETFLAFRVRVADSIFGRLKGLLGKRSLQPDSGVWIVPANAIHTIGMLFTCPLGQELQSGWTSRTGAPVSNYHA